METSPAKALESAADQIARNSGKSARNIVFLAHDGQSTDSMTETLESM